MLVKSTSQEGAAATLRLTASVVISSEVAGAKLNRRELVNYSKIR